MLKIKTMTFNAFAEKAQTMWRKTEWCIALYERTRIYPIRQFHRALRAQFFSVLFLFLFISFDDRFASTIYSINIKEMKFSQMTELF